MRVNADVDPSTDDDMLGNPGRECKTRQRMNGRYESHATSGQGLCDGDSGNVVTDGNDGIVYATPQELRHGRKIPDDGQSSGFRTMFPNVGIQKCNRTIPPRVFEYVDHDRAESPCAIDDDVFHVDYAIAWRLSAANRPALVRRPPRRTAGSIGQIDDGSASGSLGCGHRVRNDLGSGTVMSRYGST